MKGFIEVTDYDGGMKVLLPVSKITAIVCDDDGSGFPYGRIERTQNASENLLPRKRNQK